MRQRDVSSLGFLLLLISTSLVAQTFRGTILGTVTDPQGAVVSGATINVRNINTGLERKTQTSAAIFAAGAGICLLESLKDDALFIERNTDSSIGNFEGDNRSGAIQNSVLVAPTVPYNRN